MLVFFKAKKTSVILHNISHFQSLKNHVIDIRLLSLQIFHETFYISANGFWNIGYGTVGSVMIKLKFNFQMSQLINFVDNSIKCAVFDHHNSI